MIQSWENLMPDRRMEAETDKTDYIGRCPTNFECPIAYPDWTIESKS